MTVRQEASLPRSARPDGVPVQGLEIIVAEVLQYGTISQKNDVEQRQGSKAWTEAQHGCEGPLCNAHFRKF